MTLPSALLKRIVMMLSLALVVATIWSFIFNRWRPADWATPVSYHGDAIYALAMIKLGADGDLGPIGYVQPTSLGAPFIGNLNDFPLPERTLYWMAGVVARAIGLGLAANLAVVCAHVLAALSFYLACRLWRIERSIAWLLAVPYAFLPYILVRSLPHLGLAFYGLLPLQFYTCWHLATSCHFSWRSPRYRLSIFVAVLSGIFNVYYVFIFLQLCAFALLRRIITRQHLLRALVPPLLTVVVVATILGSYLLYGHTHGKNAGAVVRDYQGLEAVALKPLDLVLPLSGQAFGLFDSVRTEYAANSALMLLESNTTYVGLIGVFGLVLLLVRSIQQQLAGSPPPLAAMVVLWIIAFATFGGLNALFGLFTHIYLFRGTNRYSIAIATVAFLYVASRLGRWFHRRPASSRIIFVGAVAVAGLFDQARTIFGQYRPSAQSVAAEFNSDRALAAQLERSLSPGSMIFQLPVMDFPEVPAVYHLDDYEQFRPFLFSNHLRFSYGSNKGRALDGWQHEVSSKPVGDMVSALRSYGFAAILLNRKGYPDDATGIIGTFAQAGIPPVFEQGEWVFFALTPASAPVLPPTSFVFARGWMPREISGASWFHWTSETNGCEIQIGTPARGHYHFYFTVGSLSARQVKINLNGRALKTCVFPNGGEQVVDVEVKLPAGESQLSFATDHPAVRANNGDSRLFTFYVKDLRIAK